MPAYRSDVVGSLLRPAYLKEARERFEAGEMSAAAFKRNRLEQIFRDVRMGKFHPGNTLLAHELLGKLCLGVNPDDKQRWG